MSAIRHVLSQNMDVLEREKSLSLEVLIGFFVDIYNNALISILKLIIDRIF